MAFWPFTKWTHSPPPWGPSQYNVPVELRQSSFMAARTGMTPMYPARVAAFFSTPMTKYMVSPMRVHGAISKHPGDAFQTVSDAHDHLKGLADRALGKHLQGLPLTHDEGRALLEVHMPPVVRPRERVGASTVSGPDWDVPFVDRSTVPQDIRNQVAALEAPIEAQRKLAVGREIAMIEAIRAHWLAMYPGGGR